MFVTLQTTILFIPVLLYLYFVLLYLYLLSSCIYILLSCIYILFSCIYILFSCIYILFSCIYILFSCIYIFFSCIYIFFSCIYIYIFHNQAHMYTMVTKVSNLITWKSVLKFPINVIFCTYLSFSSPCSPVLQASLLPHIDPLMFVCCRRLFGCVCNHVWISQRLPVFPRTFHPLQNERVPFSAMSCEAGQVQLQPPTMWTQKSEIMDFNKVNFFIKPVCSEGPELEKETT